jgi:hypothetical protein
LTTQHGLLSAQPLPSLGSSCSPGATTLASGCWGLVWQAYPAISVICKPRRGFAKANSKLNTENVTRSFFQLATRYPAVIAQAFGGYAAGSGAAGLIGSFLYTFFTTSLGARPSAVLSAVGLAPILMSVTYSYILPSAEEVEKEAGGNDDEDENSEDSLVGALKLGDKLQLVKPMIWQYMAPLAILMFLENVTTQVGARSCSFERFSAPNARKGNPANHHLASSPFRTLPRWRIT